MTRPLPHAMPSLHPMQRMRAALNQWLHRLNRQRLERRRLRRAVSHYLRAAAAEKALAETLRPHWEARARQLTTPPLFSVLWLPERQDSTAVQAIADALARQAYAHWELLTDRPIEPGCSDARVVRGVAPQQETGTRFETLLAQARGEYVLLLRSGEQLAAPHALLLFAEAAEHFGRPPLIYADEDGLDSQGQRHSPWFKCGWNQELQRATHYLGHAYVLRTDLVRRAGGLRGLPLETGEQVLALRVCDGAPETAPVRIPHVLLQRQAARGRRIDLAPPGTAEQARALQAYLDERGILARVTPSSEAGLHVRYAVPSPAPLVSLVVPTRNGLQVLRQCIDSVLQRTRYPNYEVLIVDNGSDDPQTLAYLRQISADPRVRVRRDDRPFNFSALNNHALPECRGSVIGLLNNDTEVISPDWLDEMVGLACRPDVGAVGARLWFGNGTLQHAGVVVGIGGCAGHVHLGLARGEAGYASRACLTQEFSAVTAACLLMRREVFEAVGGLDQDHLAVDLNDVDLCLKVREAGYRIVWTPFAELFHHESVSRGKAVRPEQQARLEAERRYFAQRWAHWLKADPAFHPALSLRHTDCLVDVQRQGDCMQPWHIATPAQGAARCASPPCEPSTAPGTGATLDAGGIPPAQ